jgi:hypothetical protein
MATLDESAVRKGSLADNTLVKEGLAGEDDAAVLGEREHSNLLQITILGLPTSIP